MQRKSLRVAVLDMQPITPATGGGRQRLLGLYHALGEGIECTYVGSYDWPGEPGRDQQITPGLREITVPLSAEHHAAAAELSARLDNRTVIDIAFPDQVALSPAYLEAARAEIERADVVIFSHPWCYPPLADALQAEQLVVYDSQNVEAVLRLSLLDDLPYAAPLLRRVVEAEYALCRRADLILACSEEDVELFRRLFEVDPMKLRIVPNGTFVERFPELQQADRMALRKKLGLPIKQAIAIFLGSMYGPNADAARYIAQSVAPACPAVLFVVAGGAGDALEGISISNNVLVTGRVDDARRDELLLAADLALNPMAAGSGTNIKMFDYMAAGLPVLTTDIGARGICGASDAPTGIFVEPIEAFRARCAHLATTAMATSNYRRAVRTLVQHRYAWERISGALGKLLRTRWRVHELGVPDTTRVAMMTTWNVTCGIGEHASYLADAMQLAGADLLILGNTLTGHEVLGFEHDLQTAVARVWHWDNITWKSFIDYDRFEVALRAAHPVLLVVQHHTAYAPFPDIEKAVKIARGMDIRVAIEMHNARDEPIEHKNRLCALGAELFVHEAGELANIDHEYRARTHLMHHPVKSHAKRKREFHYSRESSIVIGGFGFLRPYKGLPEVIHALALLRPKYPHIRYMGLHAMYPGDASVAHLQECLQLAQKLGCRDAINIDTEFLPIDEVGRQLATTDMVVMPYNPSNEGASGAVNHALAVGLPVIVSPSVIFRSVSAVTYAVAEHEPAAYAEAINHILCDPVFAAELAQRASNWAEQHSYANAATILRNIIYPVAESQSSNICQSNS